MKFDDPRLKCCAHDSCRIDFKYVYRSNIKAVENKRGNTRFYCSQECLDKQYNSLGLDGAVHLIHQKFGPIHPVTKQIQKMREELAELRKDTDYLERSGRGHEHEDRNFKRLCHMTEKCL